MNRLMWAFVAMLVMIAIATDLGIEGSRDEPGPPNHGVTHPGEEPPCTNFYFC